MRSSRRRLGLRADLLAVSTGFAGCLMMLLAFVYITLYGEAVFIEPNTIILHLELVIFAIGVVANLVVGFRVARR